MWWCSLIPGKRLHWFWWNLFLCPMHPKNIKRYLGLSFKFSLINWQTLHVLAVATLPIAPWRYNATVPSRILHARLLVLFHSKPARLAVVVLSINLYVNYSLLHRAGIWHFFICMRRFLGSVIYLLEIK